MAKQTYRVGGRFVSAAVKLEAVRKALCTKPDSHKCSVCGFSVRGPGHEEGKHHNEGKKKGV